MVRRTTIETIDENRAVDNLTEIEDELYEALALLQDARREQNPHKANGKLNQVKARLSVAYTQTKDTHNDRTENVDVKF